MRTQTISAICLLLAGLAIGWLLSPAQLITRPSGDLMARERTVEAGRNIEVDLRIRNRPLGSTIEWHADKGRFNPEVTASDLRSMFAAPSEQGRVKLWVEVVQGARRFANVASTYIDVSRPPAEAPQEMPAHPTVAPTHAATERPKPGSLEIRFTTIPPYDPKGGPTTSADIEGQVEGVTAPDDYRIVLYAKTNGTWFVQPLTAAPYTQLDKQGQFFTWTHTGVKYGALLVRKDFKAPLAVDGELPSSPDIVARKEVNGRRKGE